MLIAGTEMMIVRENGSKLEQAPTVRMASGLLLALLWLAPVAAIGQTADTDPAAKLVERKAACEQGARRWSIDEPAKSVGWQSRGQITIGYRADAEPFSFDRDGNARGIVVEMCRKIASDAGSTYGLDNEPEFVAVEARDRFAALHRGRIDMLCDSSTLSLDRMACFGHSLMTFVSGPSLAIGRSRAKADDGEVKVGVLEGSSTKLILHRDRTLIELSERLGSRPTDIKPITFATYRQGFEALLAGDIPAFFGDREILIKRFFGESSIEVLDEYFSYEPYAIFTRKDDNDLVFSANQTLTNIFSGPEIHEILWKYLATDESTKLEVSDALRYLYILQRLPAGELSSLN